MNRKVTISIILAAASACFLGSAGAASAANPCRQIVQACQSAGFARGQWKKGYGIARDCVNPIMQGQTSVSGATKSLPSIEPGVVSACKAKHPKFGSGKVGS